MRLAIEMLDGQTSDDGFESVRKCQRFVGTDILKPVVLSDEQTRFDDCVVDKVHESGARTRNYLGGP